MEEMQFRQMFSILSPTDGQSAAEQNSLKNRRCKQMLARKIQTSFYFSVCDLKETPAVDNDNNGCRPI